MLEALAQATLALVRKRMAEGDCPITPAQSVETLEDLVLHLAAKTAPAPDPASAGDRSGQEVAR